MSNANTCLACRDYSAVDKIAIENDLSTLYDSRPADIDPADEIMKSLYSSAEKPNIPFTGKTVWDWLRMIYDCHEPIETRLLQIYREKDDIKKNMFDAQTELSKTAAGGASRIALEKKISDCDADTTSLATEEDTLNRRGTIFMELRRRQFALIIQALWSKVKTTAGIDPADSVARARLIFVWIASSITYDSKRRDAIAARTAIKFARFEGDALITSADLCEGIVSLFVQIFNRTQPAGAPRAETVSGKTKNNGGRKMNPPASDHRWVAMPLPPPPAQPDADLVYKLLDPTWGMGPASNPQLNTLWFSKSNAAFLRDHLPETRRQQYVDVHDPLPSGRVVTILPNVEPVLGLEPNEFWDQDLPFFSRSQEFNYIEPASLRPPTWTVLERDQQTFSFQSSCIHYREGMKTELPVFLSFDSTKPSAKGGDSSAASIESLPTDPVPADLIPFVLNGNTWEAKDSFRGMVSSGFFWVTIRAPYQGQTRLPYATKEQLAKAEEALKVKNSEAFKKLSTADKLTFVGEKITYRIVALWQIAKA